MALTHWDSILYVCIHRAEGGFAWWLCCKLENRDTLENAEQEVKRLHFHTTMYSSGAVLSCGVMGKIVWTVTIAPYILAI